MRYSVRVCLSYDVTKCLDYPGSFICAADLIRSIYDPEHPNTLEELRVVSAPQIKVGNNHVSVEFTPTVPHCGMSTLIGEFKAIENDVILSLD